MSLKKKLKRADGTTFVELLAASAILILLSLMLNTGFQLALRSYYKMTATAEAQLLLSTVADTISGELRYARDVTVKSGEEALLDTYTSVFYGKYTKLELDDGGRLRVQAAGQPKALLSSGVYGENGVYSIRKLVITYAAPSFSVEVEVGDGGEISASTELCVRCLNADQKNEESLT